MRRIIEMAVSTAFNAISSLMYTAKYIVVKKSGFDIDESETYVFRTVIEDDETSVGSSSGRDITNSHDLTLLFETKNLAVKAKHGDRVEIESEIYEIKQPVIFDPIKVTTTLYMKRIS